MNEHCEKCSGRIADENGFGRDYGCLKDDCPCHTEARQEEGGWRERFDKFYSKHFGVNPPYPPVVAFIEAVEKATEERTRREVLEELFAIEKEKWQDAEHCSCLGYALVELSGGEDSPEGQEMSKRLSALDTGNEKPSL